MPSAFICAIGAVLDAVELPAQDDLRVLEDRLDQRQQVERVVGRLRVEQRDRLEQVERQRLVHREVVLQIDVDPQRRPVLGLSGRTRRCAGPPASGTAATRACRCAFFAPSGSWQSRMSCRIAPQPSPGRLRTLSSIPCDTWKRDTSCSGGAPISRLKVFEVPVDEVVLRRPALRRPSCRRARPSRSSLMFSMTCSGACTTTKPRSSKPLRPARPAIWWKSRALRMRGLLPVELAQPREQHRADRHVDADAERVGAADDLEQAALRELLDEHAVLRQQPGVVQADAVLQPLADLRPVGAGELEVGDRLRDAPPSPRACRSSGS